MELVCSVLAHFSLRDMLSVLGEISSLLLKRDFLALLPPELVACVLTCLPPEEALRCVRVSRQWRAAVLQCGSYWKGVCARLGIPPAPTLSWSELARGGMRLRRRVRLGSLYLDDAYTFTERHCNVVTAEPDSAGVVVTHSGSDSLTTRKRGHFLSIHSLSTSTPLKVTLKDGSPRQPDMVEEAHVGVSRFFRLHWCYASQRYVKLYGSNGECFLHTRQDEGGPATREWTGPIVSPSLFECGSCPSCPLMVLAGKAPRVDSASGVWSLQLLRPWPAPSTAVDKFDCHFDFVPDEALIVNAFCRVRKLALLPNRCLGEIPFCSSHRILVQIGHCVVVLGIESDCGCGFSAPQQLVILSTISDPIHSAISATSSSFQLSSDNALLGIVIDSHLCCWELDSFRLTISRDPLPRTMVILMVLGRHLSVLSGGGDLRVFSTATGESLFSEWLFGLDVTSMFGPINPAWLGTPDTREVLLELAMVHRDRFTSTSMTRLYLQ